MLGQAVLGLVERGGAHDQVGAGIAQAGGAGKIIAEWVAHGEPEWDVWPLDSRRYLEFANDKFVLAKAIEKIKAFL